MGRNGGSKAKLPERISTSLDVGITMVFHDDEGIRESAAKVIGCAFELLKGENEMLRERLIQENILNASLESVAIKHGICCAIYRTLSSSASTSISSINHKEMSSIVVNLLNDENVLVQSAACVAIGAVIGSLSEDVAIAR